MTKQLVALRDWSYEPRTDGRPTFTGRAGEVVRADLPGKAVAAFVKSGTFVPASEVTP